MSASFLVRIPSERGSTAAASTKISRSWIQREQETSTWFSTCPRWPQCYTFPLTRRGRTLGSIYKLDRLDAIHWLSHCTQSIVPDRSATRQREYRYRRRMMKAWLHECPPKPRHLLGPRLNCVTIPFRVGRSTLLVCTIRAEQNLPFELSRRRISPRLFYRNKLVEEPKSILNTS